MLGVAESVPLVLNAQALPDPAQQGLWSGAYAGKKLIPRRSALPLSCRRHGDHIHDPGAGRPLILDVPRCLLPLCGSCD